MVPKELIHKRSLKYFDILKHFKKKKKKTEIKKCDK